MSDALSGTPPPVAPGGPAMPARTGIGPLAVAILFGVVGIVSALAVTHGVWSAPSRALLGDWTHPDMLSNHWVYDWVARQLRSGASLLHNDDYYADVGDAPFLAGNASGALLAAPFLWAFGHPLGINLYMALTIALNVATGAALARALGATPFPALVSGTGLGLCPYLLTELSAARFAQVPVWELAGGLALWIGAMEARSLARGALAGVLLGVAGIEYFYYGFFGGMAAGVLAAAAALARPERLRDGRWLATVALGAIVAVVTVAPLLALFVRGWSTVVGASEAESTFPHPFMLQASLPWSWPVWTDLHAMVPTHVSWILLGLAAWEVRAARRERRDRDWASGALGVVAIVGWLLALGPQLLSPQGPTDGSHLPFWWLYGAHPALARFWWPYRHAVIVSLAIAALAARGLGRLSGGLPPRLRFIVIVGVLGGVPFELRTRGAVTTVSVSRLKETPAWVAELAALPEGRVLDLPAAPELWIGQQHLALQELHGHPLVDGHAMWVDRVRPDAWDAEVKANSFLTELQRFERGQPIREDPARVDRFIYDPASVDALRAAGTRWIIVWDELFAADIAKLPGKLNTLMTALFGDPVVTGDGIAVYDLAGHRGTGDLDAPDWDWPTGVTTGDGSSRMTDDLPKSSLVENAP